MPCCVEEFQAGAIGVEFTLLINDGDGRVVDLSGTSAREMIFKPPTGASVTKTAVLGDDPGEIVYTSLANDFTVAGTWQFQGFVHWLSGPEGKTTVGTFRVKANL